MPDPGGKGIYYVNGRLSGSLTAYHVHSKQSTDIVPEGAFQPTISRDGKRVMYLTFPTSEKVELWTSDIDGGNKVSIVTSEAQEAALRTLNWAPDNFHLSFSQGPKLFIVGADGRDLRQLPSMAGMNISNAIWSPDQKSVYVSAEENAQAANTIWKWKAADLRTISTPAENTYSLFSSNSEKKLESMRCLFLKGNVYHCFPA
jgi:Tol biopolymer transport system component